jgi:RNA polymerase sigma-70 factor (ECF subfamily)
MMAMESAEFRAALAAAKRGDEAAFTALFRYAQPAVLRYLQSLAGPRGEDLAGDTWVQVVRGLGRFEAAEPARFRAWVLSIARHRWLDEQRARSRRPESLVSDVPEPPATDDVAEIVAGLMSTESALALIGSLPPDQAEVVLLRVVADLDVATTAQVTGRKPGHVRVLTHRALHRLRVLLAGAPEMSTDVTPEPDRAVN